MTMYGKIAYRLLRERLSKTLTVLAGIFLSAFLIAALETSISSLLAYATEHGIAAADLLSIQRRGSGGILHSGTIRYAGIFLCVVVAILIVAGVCALVYNAFAISVRRRADSYRILAAAGATPGQMRRIVVHECTVLAVAGILPGIPLGIWCGQALLHAVSDFVNVLFGIPAGAQIAPGVPAALIVLSFLLLYALLLFAALLPTVPIEKILIPAEETGALTRRHRRTHLNVRRQSFAWAMARRYFREALHSYMNSIVALVISMILIMTMSSLVDHMQHVIRLVGAGSRYAEAGAGGPGSGFGQGFLPAMRFVVAVFMVVMFMIVAVNVFNAISANILSRKREHVTLAALGMTMKEISRMLSLECVLYGIWSLILSLPVSIVCAGIVPRILLGDVPYIFPWRGLLPSLLCIAIVVAGAMAYSRCKLADSHLINTLRKTGV